MKKYIFGLTVVMAALLTSCNQDNESALYSNGSEGGVSFTSSTLQNVEVPASNPVFTVQLLRGNTANAASGTITATGKVGDKEISGITVTGYSFAAGESMSNVTVDVSPLTVGEQLNLTLTISDNDASIGGYKTTTLKVSKAYEWKSLGTGHFVDNFFGMESEPEILQAEGYQRWRVVAPCEAYRLDPANAADDWIASWSAPYIELWVDEATGYIFFEDWFTGQNYDGDPDAPIYGCHASGWSSMNDPEFWSFSKFVDEKTIQLAPYYYIDGVGGWNNTQKDGIVYIVLP